MTRPVLREDAIKRKWYTTGAYRTESYSSFRSRVIDKWVKSWFKPVMDQGDYVGGRG